MHAAACDSKDFPTSSSSWRTFPGCCQCSVIQQTEGKDLETAPQSRQRHQASAKPPPAERRQQSHHQAP